MAASQNCSPETQTPSYWKLQSTFLDPVLGVRFLGSRSRGFAVKILFYFIFLKIFSEFLEVLFQFLIELFPTIFCKSLILIKS